MAKKRRIKKARKGLGETISATLKQPPMTGKQIGIALGAMAAGAAVAIAFPKFSGWGAVGAIGFGVWKKNLNAASFGAGLLLAAAAKNPESGTAGLEDEMDGLDLKSISERAKSYLQSIGGKFSLPKGKSENVSGMNGSDDTSYFLNPYAQRNDTIDLSELDRVQNQVAQMSGMGEIDPTERNF